MHSIVSSRVKSNPVPRATYLGVIILVAFPSQLIPFFIQVKTFRIGPTFCSGRCTAKKLMVNHVPSNEQVTDALTKPLSALHFNYLGKKLTVEPPAGFQGRIIESISLFRWIPSWVSGEEIDSRLSIRILFVRLLVICTLLTDISYLLCYLHSVMPMYIYDMYLISETRLQK